MTLPINNAQIAHTTAEWAALSTYVLAADVIGIEVMINGYNRYKRGDGVTAWTSLAYLKREYAIPIDDTPTEGSDNPLSSGGAYIAFAAKQDTLAASSGGISSAISVPSSTSTVLKSLTLPAGTYELFANVMYAPNATGYRGIRIHSSSTYAPDYGETKNAVNGTYTSMNCNRLYTLSAETTIYLTTYQNSGSTLSVTIATLNAIKLS